MKVVGDLKQGHFERNYKEKTFADTGVISAYLQRWVFSTWYVQVKKGNEYVWCTISTETAEKMKTEMPSGTKVKISGKIAEWYLNDDTLRLDDQCAIVRQ